MNTSTVNAGVYDYGGGGYVFKVRGYIKDLETKVLQLKESKWLDNRTRAVIVEFSVYNAQINMFSIVKIVAEEMGGGFNPYHRIDVIKLTDLPGQFVTILVQLAQILFGVSLFYYIISLITVLKNEGCKGFCADLWNLSDLVTIVLSLGALILYFLQMFEVAELTKNISLTKGNE